MTVISSIGTPARRSRTTESATPVAPESREARPAADSTSDQRSESQTTTVASSSNQT